MNLSVLAGNDDRPFVLSKLDNSYHEVSCQFTGQGMCERYDLAADKVLFLIKLFSEFMHKIRQS